MDAARLALGLLAIGLVVTNLAAADPPPVPPEPGEARGDAQPKLSFAVWHVPGAPKDFTAIREMLGQDGADVASIDAYGDWLRSPADVLVLRATDETGMPSHDAFLEGRDLEPLKGRRVIGIGGEAGRLFGGLGLEINGGKSASFDRSKPTLFFQKTDLLPSSTGVVMTAFDAAVLPSGPKTWGCEGLFLPRRDLHRGPVEVVARWAADDRDYAPIARQQNYVFCGINADVRAWTDEFRSTFRAMAHALARRPSERFALAEWDVTAPGTYSIELRRHLFGGSDLQRTFRFRFDGPVLFSAEVDVETSDHVSLLFHAEKDLRQNHRVDGAQGETLRILMPILPSHIEANGGRYWMLDVTNYGRITAKCTFRVEYPKDVTLRVAEGMVVEMRNPPRDPVTIERLVALLSTEDSLVSTRADAALMIVGRPALGALEAAKKTLRWPADKDRILRIGRLTNRIERLPEK